MVIQEALVSYIEANVSEVGTGYPLFVPQDADLPAWAYQRINPSREQMSHAGATGLVTDRFQITVQGSEDSGVSAYGVTIAAAEALRAALDGYQGLMGTLNVDGCFVRSIDDDWALSRELPVARLEISVMYRRS